MNIIVLYVCTQSIGSIWTLKSVWTFGSIRMPERWSAVIPAPSKIISGGLSALISSDTAKHKMITGKGLDLMLIM